MIQYFGYGANSSEARLRQILGHVSLCQGAVLSGYRLNYQILKQISDPRVREILGSVWGKDFQVYTLRKGKGLVVGKLWELSESDLDKIKDWEFIGQWRKLIKVKVLIFNNQLVEAMTDIACETESVFGEVDGLNYEFDLNPRGRRLVEPNPQDIKQLNKLRKMLKVYIERRK